MANFDANQTEVAAIGASDTVKTPTVDQAADLQGLSSLFKTAEDLLVRDTANRKQGVVANLRNDLGKLVNAVDQGTLSPQAARSRMRNTFMQYNTNYEQLSDELASAYGQFLNTSGFGSVVSDNMREYQRKQNLVTQLVNAGWMSPGATPEQQQRAISEFQTFQMNQNLYQEKMNTLNLQIRAAQGNSAEQARLKAEQAALAKTTAFTQVPGFMKMVQAEVTRINDLFGDNPTMAGEEYDRWFLANWFNNEEVMEMKSHLESTDVKYLDDMVEKLKETYRGAVDGSISQAERDRILKQVETEAQILVNNIDQFPEFKALLDGMGDGVATILLANSSITSKMQKGMIDLFNKDVGQETASVFTNPEIVPLYQELVKNEAVTSEAREELAFRIAEGIQDQARALEKDPTKANEAIRFFASPEFLELSRGSAAFRGSEAAIKSIVQTHYHQEVMQAVRDELEDNQIIARGLPTEGGTQVVAASSLVSMSIGPNGYTFVPADSSLSAREMANKLNKEVASVANRSIMAMAHIEGNSNYAEMAKKSFELIFGNVQDNDEDFEISSFTPTAQSNMASYRDAIAAVESKGSGDYQALGPVITSGRYKGEQALGRYQVMPGNLPQWSREALGREITPEEFLSNPIIQDMIFDHRFGILLEKYGNPDDAASAWFTGQPLSVGGSRSDGNIDGNEYVKRFKKALGGN